MTDNERFICEQPVSAGFIEPDVFDSLAGPLRAQFNGGAWIRSVLSNKLRPTGSAKPALQPVTELLSNYILAELNEETTKISFDCDSRPALSGQTQRGIDWHVDNGGTASYVMAASNVIPTEFLVYDKGSEDADMRRNRILNQSSDRPGSMFNSPAIDAGLSEGLFKIYQPEPYEAVILTKNIHRSTRNMSKRAIDRTFLRGWIYVKRN